MDSESESIKSHTESEEDDVGCYFLQPSSAPYNITEKVQQANSDLFNQQHQALAKTVKVKFREELISFEPDDLTDDDVNSIESDHTEQSIDTRPTLLEYKTISNESLTIFDIEEDVLEEDVLEEVESDSEHEPVPPAEVKAIAVADKDKTLSVEAVTASSRKRRKASAKSKAAFLNPAEVNCKDHCIDKLDRDLSVAVKKLDINEKVDLPPLQLIQRKCCDEVKKKVHQRLPSYNGSRSEYGLTSRQLEKREKHKEMLKMRERMRQQLIEEYKRRKMQQNEEVFRQWLKEVSRRKSEKKNNSSSGKKRVASAKESTGYNKTTQKIAERPKTANAFIPRTKTRKKKRTQSSGSKQEARVYIEVPRNCLEKSLRVGGLVIRNSKLFSRNVHIIALS
ncbi:hypothetical protein NQ315_012635 [Exocentrus adspersus]|uniref:Coiled-coil domain-containing protein 181 n=1 Tax=Exocentrus adspersus TaxID=1586481 RepID=A0AAV8VS65_9CUCU|nr:hypothetical protein NQ315_012635 [Exocentrus adspersus]